MASKAKRKSEWSSSYPGALTDSRDVHDASAPRCQGMHRENVNNLNSGPNPSGDLTARRDTIPLAQSCGYPIGKHVQGYIHRLFLFSQSPRRDLLPPLAGLGPASETPLVLKRDSSVTRQ